MVNIFRIFLGNESRTLYWKSSQSNAEIPLGVPRSPYQCYFGNAFRSSYGNLLEAFTEIMQEVITGILLKVDTKISSRSLEIFSKNLRNIAHSFINSTGSSFCCFFKSACRNSTRNSSEVSQIRPKHVPHGIPLGIASELSRTSKEISISTFWRYSPRSSPKIPL